MKTTKAALIAIIVAFPLGLLLGQASHYPATGKEVYQDLRVFTEVLSLISEQYVEPVDSKDLIYGALRGMLREIDPHSAFLTPDMFKEMQIDTKGEFGGLGIQIGIRNGVLTVIAPIEDTPAWEAGIQAGDQIIKVDGNPTKDMTVQEAVNLMRGKPGTEVTVTIAREGADKLQDYTITRGLIHLKSLKHRSLGEGIGYLRVTQFQENTTGEVREALEGLGAADGSLKGLLIDLRGNPGGLLDEAVGVSSLFLEKGKSVVSIKGREGKNSRDYPSRGSNHYLEFPIIVLIDGGTASASEIVSGALRDWGRAVLLGTPTFGKGSVQTISPLSDGSALKLTTALYFTPKGISIQGDGITPDLLVEKVREEQLARPVESHVKEKDLERSLEAPLMEPTLSEEEAPAAEEEGTSPGTDSAIPENDSQLKRAYLIMKSWLLLGNMKSQTP